MKIAVVSASDSKGGAARIAGTLVKGLRERGHTVDFLVGRNDGGSIASSTIETTSAQEGLAASVTRRLIHRSGLNNSGIAAPFPKQTSGITFSDYDIVHLHDPPSLNFSSLPWLSRQCPMVWTIHSMAPLTGNCVYPFECDRWTHGCGKCPQFSAWPLDSLHRDASSWIWKLKRWSYNRSSFTAIGVSKWISERIGQGILSGRPVATIQNAVSAREFFPEDREQARANIGVSEPQFAIAFATASNPRDTRKGMDIILKAAQQLPPNDNYVFMPMSIGSATDELQTRLSKHARVLSPQHLSTSQSLREYYSAADLVWHPSRADTSSMVSLEAMACGTPVVAASVGGVPEVIGDAGILISAEDPTALARETETLRSEPEQLARLSLKSVERVAQHFNAGRFIDEHEELYHSLATGR